MMIYLKIRVPIERRGSQWGGQMDPKSVPFYMNTFETTSSFLYQVHSTSYISYLDSLNKKGGSKGGQMDPKL